MYKKYLVAIFMTFLFAVEAGATITDMNDRLSPCTGKLVNNIKGEVFECKGKKKAEFYYNVDRSKEQLFTTIRPIKQAPVYSLCDGVVYGIMESVDNLQDVFIRCNNSNIVVVVYYIKSMLGKNQINQPIKWTQKIGDSAVRNNGRDDIVLEIIDINTKEYLNGEQIFNPAKFGMKHPEKVLPTIS